MKVLLIGFGFVGKATYLLKNKDVELDKINAETKLAELQLKIAQEEANILKLKLKLEKSNKIDNITLKQYSILI